MSAVLTGARSPIGIAWSNSTRRCRRQLSKEQTFPTISGWLFLAANRDQFRCWSISLRHRQPWCSASQTLRWPHNPVPGSEQALFMCRVWRGGSRSRHPAGDAPSLKFTIGLHLVCRATKSLHLVCRETKRLTFRLHVGVRQFPFSLIGGVRLFIFILILI